MTRSTKFNAHTYAALSVFERPGDIPTIPRGLTLVPPPGPLHQWFSGQFRPAVPRRSLRPTWLAVVAAGVVGTLAGVLIAVLSAPVVGG